MLDGAGHTIDGNASVNGSEYKAVYVGQTGLEPDTITNVTVENVLVSEWNTGVFLERVTDGTVRNVTVTDGIVGVHLFGTAGNSGHLVEDTAATRNDRGLLLEDTEDSEVRNSNISDNRVGVLLKGAQRNVFSGLETSSNTDAGFSLVSSGTTNTVENLTLANATVDFEGTNVSIGSVSSPPLDPASGESIGRYVEAASTGPDTAVDLRMYYTDADVEDIDESGLRMWRYDGSWSQVTGTNDVNTTSNYVFASSQQAGVFTPIAPKSVVHRVNAGGGNITALDGAIDWGADTDSNPSPYTNANDANSNTYDTSNTITLTESVPSGTPMEVFQTERWDPASGAEMQWDFPVTDGDTYEVRLYFAEIYHNGNNERQFDVTLEAEGTVVLDSYDIHAEVGHDVGVMKAFRITPDSNLDIDFQRVTENPKISAIELVHTANNTNNAAPTASFSYSPTSPATNETITFDASGSSDSDGQIQSYEWDVDGDGTIDATGEEITTSYSSTGNKTVVLTVTDEDGAASLVSKTVTVS